MLAEIMALPTAIVRSVAETDKHSGLVTAADCVIGKSGDWVDAIVTVCRTVVPAVGSNVRPVACFVF